MKTLQNGSFQSPAGVVVANGKLILTISQDAEIIAGGQVKQGLPAVINLDANGDVAGTPQVYGQEELSPGGTFYYADILDSNGNRIRETEKWVITGASPINLDLMVPTLVNPDPAFSNPVLQNPSAAQTIAAQPLTINLLSNATSATSNPATSGILRLASGDAVAWRNAGNTSNLLLAKGALNTPEAITWNGLALPSPPAAFTPISLTAQTASIGTTTLYAVPSSGSGIYRVIVHLLTTTAGSAGTVLATIGWNNGSAKTLNSSSAQLNTLGDEAGFQGGTTQAGVINIFSAASQNITYATTVSGAAGNPEYALRIRLEYLG